MLSTHTIGHLGFLPLGIAYLLGVDINNDRVDTETGIHSYARWMLKNVLNKFVVRSFH